MSYNIDGKLANQPIRGGMLSQPKCAKCCKQVSVPKEGSYADIAGNTIYTIQSYLSTPHYIYETKSGRAVVYCSAYCRNKHNHRFQGVRQ